VFVQQGQKQKQWGFQSHSNCPDFKKVTQNELGKYEVEDQIAAAKN
jgi:hypothetical protein